ncbi:MAM domain-containing glycosylphosphatidylinositol anchor protein 2 isoform X2 [Tachysurus ichikawai]
MVKEYTVLHYFPDLDDPVVTVHQSIGEAKEQFYYERTVFLRCVANSNPPVRYSWHRGRDVLSQGSDKGVEIYEPFFTQGETKILKLKNLRPKDYANYSCIASVRNVCGIPDRRVIFRLTNKTASPSIKLLVEDPIVVNPGQTVSLVCIATGGEPPPTLTWTSVSEHLPEKSVLKDGTLTLPAISSEEAGIYSCIASNNVGNPAKKSTTIIVRALEKPSWCIAAKIVCVWADLASADGGFSVHTSPQPGMTFSLAPSSSVSACFWLAKSPSIMIHHG